MWGAVRTKTLGAGFIVLQSLVKKLHKSPSLEHSRGGMLNDLSDESWEDLAMSSQPGLRSEETRGSHMPTWFLFFLFQLSETFTSNYGIRTGS